jgi:hypothetical protein
MMQHVAKFSWLLSGVCVFSLVWPCAGREVDSFFGEELIVPQGRARARVAVVQMLTHDLGQLMLADDGQLDYWDMELTPRLKEGNLEVLWSCMMEGDAEQPLKGGKGEDDGEHAEVSWKARDLEDHWAVTNWDVDYKGLLVREHKRAVPWSHTTLLAAQSVPNDKGLSQVVVVRMEGGLRAARAVRDGSVGALWWLSLDKNEFLKWQLAHADMAEDAATVQRWLHPTWSAGQVKVEAVAACGYDAIVAYQADGDSHSHYVESAGPVVRWESMREQNVEMQLSAELTEKGPVVVKGWLDTDDRAKVLVMRRPVTEMNRAKNMKPQPMAMESVWKVHTTRSVDWLMRAASLSHDERVPLAELLLASCRTGEAQMVDSVLTCLTRVHVTDELSLEHAKSKKEWTLDWQVDSRMVDYSSVIDGSIKSLLAPVVGEDGAPEVFAVIESKADDCIQWWIVRHEPQSGEAAEKGQTKQANFLHAEWPDGTRWVMPVCAEVESDGSWWGRQLRLAGGRWAADADGQISKGKLPAKDESITAKRGDGLHIQLMMR